MTRTRRRKCRQCGQLYEPDPRNRYHQRYCSQPACRQASKAASQRRWLTSPNGEDYFRGSANRQRVKAWRQAHPGYWRKRSQMSRALQDHCAPQVLVPAEDKAILNSRALQDLIRTQGLALTGLVAQLTGSALQENIASTTRRLIRLGREIQGPASGRPAYAAEAATAWRRPADGCDQACAVPGAIAAGAAAVQLDRPSAGSG